MTEDQSKSGTNAAVVIVVVLLLLCVPCLAGVAILGGLAFVRLEQPGPGSHPPDLAHIGKIADNATITINNMNWSQNLFDEAEGSLTLSRYDQIKPGMTYEDVVTTLAIPENRRPDDIALIGPESDVELKWFGGPEDAASITVKMKGKVVIDKAQTGLK